MRPPGRGRRPGGPTRARPEFSHPVIAIAAPGPPRGARFFRLGCPRRGGPL